ncbi:hypothetical protein Pfo_020989 [Paulownia fortunei]|nr:hypothetical protein Pfo_020989 [Paulownia fortunei]
MAHTPPTGTLWALLAAPEKPEQQQAPLLPLLPPPTPPVPTKEEAPSAHMETKPSFEAEMIPETNKILDLSNSERKSFKELILLVQEALTNHEFSAAPKEIEPQIVGTIPKLKVESSPQKVSIWGVPLLKDDRTGTILLKFLIARNFNVGESFTMLKNVIRWRREFNIDGLMEQLDLRDDLQKVMYVHGHDKEGHPLYYNMYGEFQNKEVYMNTFGDEDKRMNFVRRMIQMLERSIRKLDFSAVGVSTFLMVFDLKNSPGPGKKEIRIACNQLHQLLQDNYPEFVKKQVFINVPRWYLAFHSVIRPFLSDHTKSKFVFAGPSKTVDTLLNYISPGNLPIQYGGLNSRYPHIQNPEFTADDAATEIEIKPLTKQSVGIFLDENCNISWELRVLEWGVSFDAEFVPDCEDAYTVIVHKKRKMACSDEAVVYYYKFKVNEPGKIVLTIDNPTSKRKRLMYRFKVKANQN